MKITQKMIRNYLNEKNSIDCTMMTDDVYRAISRNEGGFREIARSHGVYGGNGIVCQGRNTGIYYVVTKRSSAFFLFA